MATFTFNDVIAEGSPSINSETGETSQLCTVVTLLSGLVKPDMKLTDSVTFIVSSSDSITAAWLNIRDVQAPQWVADNYANA